MSFLQYEIDAFPDLLELHQAVPERYPFILESVVNTIPGSSQRHWDILFAFPGQRLELGNEGVKLDDDIVNETDFLNQLDHLWSLNRYQQVHSKDTELPFTGGWFLYLGYELAQQIESSLNLINTDNNAEPYALAVRCPVAILRDHSKQRIVVIAEHGFEDCLPTILADLDNLQNVPNHKTAESMPFEVTHLQEESPKKFLSAVERIKNYITEGDIFQVNLSRQWCARITNRSSAAGLYRILRQKNPAPFSGLCTTPEWSVISSSPERLVAVNRTRMVTTRPIAGTHPRYDDAAQDADISRNLLRHPKEQAEHIMLIDLERNDLGRVSQPGTVKVDELMTLESYAHVHHIVSNIQGKLREEITPGDVIRAVFPGGTITGCPKVRCMEIIAELEQQARGCYTGAMGYLNSDGSMDLNILIRSFNLHKNILTLRAGAGIVSDSIPTRELAETRAKALGLLLALGRSESELRNELGWAEYADQWRSDNSNISA